MAYTPDPLDSEPAYGNLPTSGQFTKMTGFIASNIQTVDATGTPVTSPVTVNGAKTLVIPEMALQCQLSAGTAFDISDDSTHAAFFTIPANAIHTVDCWRMPKLYLNTGSSIAISFAFKMLN